MERLDKFVAERANIARKDAKSVIKRGRVSVNGVTEFSPEIKVDTEEVCFDGVILPQSPFIYIIMNKPSGVLSASTDKRQQTVIDLVPETLRRKEIFPVGRLDKDTTGLLIITNDGASAHSLCKAEIPQGSQSCGYILAGVKPGMVFISFTSTAPSLPRTTKSTLASPLQPSVLKALTAAARTSSDFS